MSGVKYSDTMPEVGEALMTIEGGLYRQPSGHGTRCTWRCSNDSVPRLILFWIAVGREIHEKLPWSPLKAVLGNFLEQYDQLIAEMAKELNN